MRDKDFKESVINQKISFRSGIAIDCRLEIKKKLNELGETHIVNYSVLIVKSFTESGKTTQFERRSRKRPKVNPDNQFDMFSFSDEDEFL